jgi:hypothetical protein
MKRKSEAEVLARLDEQILTIRGQKVILASNLAAIYGVETKALNRAVKRNAEKFPDDFMFLVTREELANLKYQIGTSSWGGVRRALPYAFTEHGAMMAANVLRSPRAAQMSVFVVRAFVRMRALLAGDRQLAKELAALEKKLTDRLDVHESAIIGVLRRVMLLLDPPPSPPRPPKPKIGFKP